MSRAEAQIADTPAEVQVAAARARIRTEAQKAASRSNGSRSRGPVTDGGKHISRKNSYKHGMAGSGVVLTPVDSAEVDNRRAEMLVELVPKTGLGRYLVRRLAELTVLVESCSRSRRAATALRVNHAEAAFDEARLAEVDHLISWIGREPATNSRRLRSMPEGIDRMIAELLELAAELLTGRWDWFHGEKVAELIGYRYQDVPCHRVRALSEASVGSFEFLAPSDGAGLSDVDRITWAREAMAELIDREIEKLLAIQKLLDYEGIEEDRACAEDLALIDMSKEGVLARRYETAAEKEVLRVLKKLEEVEAAALEVATLEEPPASEAPGSSRNINESRSEPRPAAPPAWPPTPALTPKPTRPATAKPLDLGGEGYFELPFSVGQAPKR